MIRIDIKSPEHKMIPFKEVHESELIYVKHGDKFIGVIGHVQNRGYSIQKGSKNYAGETFKSIQELINFYPQYDYFIEAQFENSKPYANQDKASPIISEISGFENAFDLYMEIQKLADRLDDQIDVVLSNHTSIRTITEFKYNPRIDQLIQNTKAAIIDVIIQKFYCKK